MRELAQRLVRDGLHLTTPAAKAWAEALWRDLIVEYG